MISLPLILQPADLVFVSGTSWVSRMIRRCETQPGEQPALASHVAGVVSSSMPIDGAMIVEALRKVTRRNLIDAYGDGKEKIKIVRNVFLNSWQRAGIAAEASAKIGQGYGYGKIALQALDAGLSWIFRRDVNVFRRFACLPEPICSTLWAKPYASRGITFGVDADAANPDEMLDYIQAHPEEWEVLRDWEYLTYA